MALVKMLTQISGMRDGVEWPAVGESIDVPSTEADDLVRMSLAAKVAPAKTERAIVEPKVETATVKRAPAKSKG